MVGLGLCFFSDLRDKLRTTELGLGNSSIKLSLIFTLKHFYSPGVHTSEKIYSCFHSCLMSKAKKQNSSTQILLFVKRSIHIYRNLNPPVLKLSQPKFE